MYGAVIAFRRRIGFRMQVEHAAMVEMDVDVGVVEVERMIHHAGERMSDRQAHRLDDAKPHQHQPRDRERLESRDRQKVEHASPRLNDALCNRQAHGDPELEDALRVRRQKPRRTLAIPFRAVTGDAEGDGDASIQGGDRDQLDALQPVKLLVERRALHNLAAPPLHEILEGERHRARLQGARLPCALIEVAVDRNEVVAVFRRHGPVEPVEQTAVGILGLPQRRGLRFIREQLQPAVPKLPTCSTPGHSKEIKHRSGAFQEPAISILWLSSKEELNQSIAASRLNAAAAHLCYKAVRPTGTAAETESP